MNDENLRAYWDKHSPERIRLLNCPSESSSTYKALYEYIQDNIPEEQAMQYMKQLIKKMNEDKEEK